MLVAGRAFGGGRPVPHAGDYGAGRRGGGDCHADGEYLYQHLPAWIRRNDEPRLLERFLQWFGAELNALDTAYDEFWRQINPVLAREEFVDWRLWNLFGWSCFPAWLTLARKRQFYRHIAGRLARRGTKASSSRFGRFWCVPKWSQSSSRGAKAMLARVITPLPGRYQARWRRRQRAAQKARQEEE